jgi:uncharacterized membrane protein YciS (DUF1049 family)
MRVVLRILLGVAVVALAAALIVENSEQEVTVRLLVMQFTGVRVWLVIVGSLLAGATLTGLACSWPIVRYRLRLRKARQRIAELEQELHGLRTLPLGDEADGEPRAREA